MPKSAAIRAAAGLEAASRFLDELIRNRVLRWLGGAGIVAYVALGTGTLSVDIGGIDYWQHLAAIRSLSSNLLAPPPLYFTEPYEVHLYTPFHLLWAAVRTAGVTDAWTLLVLMGIVNAGLFLFGARLLARHLLRDPRLDVATALVLLTFWRRPITWSGIYSLGQLPMQATYPSFFALSVSLIVGALWMEEGFRSRRWLLGLAVVVALVFATHPITASFLLLFLALKTLVLLRLDSREVLTSGAVLAGGLLLGTLWPLYSLPTLMLAAPETSDFFGDVDAFYQALRHRTGPEVLGLLALPLVARKPLGRFVAALLAATLLIYVGNYYLELSHIFSRYLIFVTFSLHLAVIAAVAAVRGRSWGAPVVAAVLVIAILAGLNQVRIASNRTHGLLQDIRQGVPAGTHAVKNKYRELARLSRLGELRPGVVMAPLEWAYMVSALTDHKVVGVMHSAPTMPDFEARRADVVAFFDTTISADARTRIIRRWAADYALMPNDAELETPPPAADWTAVHDGDLFRFYALPESSMGSSAGHRIRRW